MCLRIFLWRSTSGILLLKWRFIAWVKISTSFQIFWHQSLWQLYLILENFLWNLLYFFCLLVRARKHLLPCNGHCPHFWSDRCPFSRSSSSSKPLLAKAASPRAEAGWGVVHEQVGGVILPHHPYLHHVLLKLLRLEPVELDRVPQPVLVVLLLGGGGPLPC